MGVVANGHGSSPSEGVRLRRMITEHGEAIARHLVRLGTPNGDVDDLAQQTFLVAASKLLEVANGEERPFLYGVASRLASNARRSAMRRRRASARLAELFDGETTPEDVEDRRRTRARVGAALQELPVDLRTVFVACDLEEMSVSEIAAELGIAEGTAASRLRRARQTMREKLATPLRRPLAGTLSPEVLSWWVIRGEVEALEAVLSIYRRSYPLGAVINGAVRGSSTARRELEMRMACGTPPDTFQANGGVDLFAWVDATPRLAPLDTLVDTANFRSIFHEDVLDLVTRRGHVYGVPIDIHRLNTLFYDRPTFERLGLAPPRTLTEFYELAGELRKAGITPLSLGVQQPWALTLLAFENILIAVAGPEYFRAFFGGQRNPLDDEIRETLVHTARMLDCANPDATRLTWDQAIDRLGAGSAMTIMGDWARGYLRSHSRSDRASGSFASIASPGTEGTFVFACDTFALPARAPHPETALELLSVFMSNDGQDAFNGFKGSIPARQDTELDDPGLRETMDAFRNCAHVQSLASMVPSTFVRAIDAAMAGFARDRDADAVVSSLRTHYSLLGRAPR